MLTQVEENVLQTLTPHPSLPACPVPTEALRNFTTVLVEFSAKAEFARSSCVFSILVYNILKSSFSNLLSVFMFPPSFIHFSSVLL